MHESPIILLFQDPATLLGVNLPKEADKKMQDSDVELPPPRKKMQFFRVFKYKILKFL